MRDPDARERSEEAKTYRLRLREAEAQVAERDAAIGALRGELDRLHRAEAERLANTLANPADLWLVTELDDDGRLDAEKTKTRVEAVLADRPAWRRRSPSFDGGARMTPPQIRRPGLADLLKPQVRR